MPESVSWPRRFDRSGVPLLIARLVLGGLFIYMGAKKVQIPSEFLKQIRLYQFLPENPPFFLNGTAIVLPWLEILCGVALILGLWLRGAALACAAMLAVFTPAILVRALNLKAETGVSFFEVKFDCGCGAGVVITWKKLIENSLLFLLAVYAMFSRSTRFCLSTMLRGQAPNSAPSAPCPPKEDTRTTSLQSLHSPTQQ